MATAGDALRREAIEEVEDCDVARKGCQELHVLAVDDSHVDRKVIEKLLKRFSCKVTAVESARSALQILGLDGDSDSARLIGLEVNMVITDYSMPGMTGYELLKRIKESSAFRELPVVVMSSEKILAHIDRCLEEGAEEFISKPLKLHDVKRLMDSLMRDKGWFGRSCRNTKRKQMSDCHTLPLPPQSSVMLLHPHGCGMSPPLQSPSSLVAPTSSSQCSPKRLKVNS